MGQDSREAPEPLRERSRGLSGEPSFQLLQTGEAVEQGLEPMLAQAQTIRSLVRLCPPRSAAHWRNLERLGTQASPWCGLPSEAP